MTMLAEVAMHSGASRYPLRFVVVPMRIPVTALVDLEESGTVHFDCIVELLGFSTGVKKEESS